MERPSAYDAEDSSVLSDRWRKAACMPVVRQSDRADEIAKPPGKAQEGRVGRTLYLPGTEA